MELYSIEMKHNYKTYIDSSYCAFIEFRHIRGDENYTCKNTTTKNIRKKKMSLSRRVSKQTSRREMLFATNLIMEMKCFHGILCEAEEHGMHE